MASFNNTPLTAQQLYDPLLVGSISALLCKM